jgi:ferredoxin
MTDVFDILVVGGGASSHAFISGLDPVQTVAVISPDNNFPVISSKSEQINWPKDASPKFSNKKLISSVLSWSENIPAKLHLKDNFIYLGFSGSGGTSFWGCSVATFEDSELLRLGFDPKEINNSYRELVQNGFPISGNEDDELRSEFSNLDTTKLHYRSEKIKNYDGIYNSGQLKVGAARTSVYPASAPSGCVGCGSCIKGCEYSSLWSADIHKAAYANFNISYFTGWAIKIIPGENFHSVTYRNSNGDIESVRAKKIILGVDPIACFALLAPLVNGVAHSRLYHNPALAWIGLSLNRTKLNEKRFGLAQSQCFYKKNGKLISFGHIFDGACLYNGNLDLGYGALINKVFNIALPNLVLGNYYLRGDLNRITLKYENGALEVLGGGKLDADNFSEIDSVVRSFCMDNKIIFLSKKIAAPGSDLHYSGGVPLELKGESPHYTNISNIFVIGGAAFTDLPPQSPTFTFMATSHAFAKKITR